MPRTWENYECSFNTDNNSNTLPDSKYVVTRNGMRRAAFVNMGPNRDVNQVISGNPAICYLDPSSLLDTAVHYQGDDDLITVVNVLRDFIEIKVEDYPQGSSTIGIAFRVARNGLRTFDFGNNDGVLSHVHVGHIVKNLAAGPDPNGMQGMRDELIAVSAQVAHKSALLNELENLSIAR
jgi:hypothetical protein